MKLVRAGIFSLALITVLALSVPGLAAASGGAGSEAAYGAGSAICTMVYFPFKATYAILGGVVGGGAYLVTAGNSRVADRIWRPSMGGDYVVTPAMLKGDQQIHFSGPR
jgi:hypothetical protein